MTFDEVLDQVRGLLQQRGRVTYRSLKLRYQMDDELLTGVVDELISAERVATDEDGKVLVWIGGTAVISSQSSVVSSQPLVSSTQPADGARAPLHAARAEATRRQLTVLFCDLVGSTTLSAQLDPEEYREVVQQYQDTCTAVIRRYEGHIAQHLGDGILVYFGYPVAHEDDAARAVRTGLEIITALRASSLQDRQLPQPLQVRIGIHTGLVVIGEIGSSEKREMLALGETPNLAARIQGQANPDEVVISTATYRLVEGLFTCENRGQPELKGVATPLTLYRVSKESDAHSRFEVVVRKGLTPLIGREHEFGLLRERWQRVKDGAGQVVLLSGEPGIGKSRLVEALKETVEHEDTRCFELRCSPYMQNSAFAPVIEHLQRTLQFQPNDTAEEKLQKLAIGARFAGPLQAETISLLATLLSLPASGSALPALSPQKQKEKTQEALVTWLCSEARQHAVTYAWEDLHWADPSTLELLTLFLAQVPTTRLLTVLTFRPEFTPPWGSHSYLSQLTLSRLGQSHVETMVEKVTGGQALSKEIVQQIVSKTDGVPLFVEELTKSVVESVGAHSSAPLQLGIPATLQDALMARLDRLGKTKEIAQLSATLGREFNYELLTAVSPLPEDTLRQGLKQLVESELVYQSGLPPRAGYLFKHALVQDTAYQSLLKSRRQQLHQQVAQVLEKQFPQTVETQPELVAHHYTEARLIEQAIPYWQRAGERATERSAYVEAVAHLTRGLELLKTLPDTPERVQQELTLQLTLGPPLQYTKGYSAPEVEQTYSRAVALCRQVGETPLLFSALFGLYGVYHVRAEYHKARVHAEQLLHLAENVYDPALLMTGHSTLAYVLSWLGELPAARAHFEQGLAQHDPQQPVPGSVESLSQLAQVLWYLGYPDQALARARESLAVARQLSLPYHVVYALHYTDVLHYYRREERAAQEQAEAAIALCGEHGIPFWLGWATLIRGGALTAQGQGEAGIKQIHQGLETLRPTGARAAWTSALALLARAYEQVGEAEAGLSVLTEALEVVHKTGERFQEAELYRLKGELLLQQFKHLRRVGNTHQPVSNAEAVMVGHAHPTEESEAEACFLKAIKIAQSQKAKSWELRAATSLARLWQQQGKRAESHKLLSEVYNWFTEGFDTKDLQEAKALLEELT